MPENADRRKERRKELFAGRILDLAVDTDIDEILCIWLKNRAGQYPIITYEDAIYSQLGEQHVGLMILAREITLEELKVPEHAPVWEQYCRERRDIDGSALVGTRQHAARRLFLHELEGGGECLVVAQDMEIRWGTGTLMPDPECPEGTSKKCKGGNI